MSTGSPYSQVVLPKTGTLTLATGAAQQLETSSHMVRFVAVVPMSGNPKIGDKVNQMLPTVALNGGSGKWIDLSTIWVSGNAGDKVGYFYSETFP